MTVIKVPINVDMISKFESDLNKTSSKKHHQNINNLRNSEKASKFKMNQYCAWLFVILTLIEIAAARRGELFYFTRAYYTVNIYRPPIGIL